MLVAASTECFPTLPLRQVFEKLVDLEFANVELAFHEGVSPLTPSMILADPVAALEQCRSTRRLNLVSFSVRQQAEGEEYYAQFDAIARIAKAVKVVTITVESGELGTPFNEEVERLRRLVDIAALQGARVSIRSQIGRLSEDPDTVVVLCDNVKGLGVTLDPSHYIVGPHSQKNIEKLMRYVYHVHLRDTSKEHLQVRIGQGEIEYGRLVNQLRKVQLLWSAKRQYGQDGRRGSYGRNAKAASPVGKPAVTPGASAGILASGIL